MPEPANDNAPGAGHGSIGHAGEEGPGVPARPPGRPEVAGRATREGAGHGPGHAGAAVRPARPRRSPGPGPR